MAFNRVFRLHHLSDTGVHIDELVFFEWTYIQNKGPSK